MSALECKTECDAAVEIPRMVATFAPFGIIRTRGVAHIAVEPIVAECDVARKGEIFADVPCQFALDGRIHQAGVVESFGCLGKVTVGAV